MFYARIRILERLKAIHQKKRLISRFVECGGTFNESSGVISTPTYPSVYHHNANCSWNIQVAENRVVALKYEHYIYV